MARVKLRGLPSAKEREDALKLNEARAIAGNALPAAPFGSSKSDKEAKQIRDDIFAGRTLPPLPVAVGDSEAWVRLLLRLRMDAAATVSRKRKAGRQYDPWTLIRAAEVIAAANAPLADSPSSRAVELIMAELGFERERARSIASRLIEHMRCIEQATITHSSADNSAE